MTKPGPTYYSGAHYLAFTSRGWRWLFDKSCCIDRAKQWKQAVIYVLKESK